MKLWAYKTQFMSGSGRYRKPRQLQMSPLLIGLSLEVLETKLPRNPLTGAVVAGFFTFALLAIWLGIWRSNAADRRFARGKLFGQYELKDSSHLQELANSEDSGEDRERG